MVYPAGVWLFGLSIGTGALTVLWMWARRDWKPERLIVPGLIGMGLTILMASYFNSWGNVMLPSPAVMDLFR